MERKDVETVLGIVSSNIVALQERVRTLPVAEQYCPTEDPSLDVLHALDAAQYNLGKYAEKHGYTIREKMRT